MAASPWPASLLPCGAWDRLFQKWSVSRVHLYSTLGDVGVDRLRRRVCCSTAARAVVPTVVDFGIVDGVVFSLHTITRFAFCKRETMLLQCASLHV